MKLLKWFFPGLGVKRWFLLILGGLILFSTGLTNLFDFNITIFLNRLIYRVVYLFNKGGSRLTVSIIAILISILGIYLTYFSLRKIKQEINQEFAPHAELVDILYEKKRLKKGVEMVAFGGGTGLANLLRGLKKFSENIVAVVTVADDGGSSGRLRDEMGILPPGDIRNCLVALADREPLMEELFQYRFKVDGDLDGHSFGNLFIAALTEILGDFEDAVQAASKVLAVKGLVLPASSHDLRLGAVYADGSVKLGESAIPVDGKKISKVFLQPDNAATTPEVLKAIQETELIIIGPGSLYTSIIPDLLIGGVADAIRSSNALKLYICNVMTQPGETDGYTVFDHVEAIIKHAGKGIFDYVVVNNARGSELARQRYQEKGAYPVVIDRKRLANQGIDIVEANLLLEEDYLRHDPDKLAALINRLSESR